jgi:enoyl-CoA hydratase/carnithine racemase
MNLLGPELVRDLVSLIQQAEADDSVQVLVFKSADPDYFISHGDVTRIKEYREEAAKLTGEASIAGRGKVHRAQLNPRLRQRLAGKAQPLGATTFLLYRSSGTA